MESIQISIDTVHPSEEEREKASSAYVMSLVAMIIGLPMPIINLIATGVFYLFSRKSTEFVKWHCRQALISQIPLFIMNNILFWWTIRILFCIQNLSSLYIAYFILVNVYNIYDLYSTTVSAIRVRKGKTYHWHLYGNITDIWMYRDKSLYAKVLLQSLMGIVVFFLSLFAINQVDWLKTLHLRETIVSDTLSEWSWQAISEAYDVDKESSLQAPVDSMLDKICIANHIDTASVQVSISNSLEVNAFSSFGGHIIVNRGLIQACDNQQELSGVLSHELAHVQLDHMRKALQQNIIMQVALIFTSGNAETVKQIISYFISNNFTRSNETDADKKAVEYLINAHQNPLMLTQFLQRLGNTVMPEFLNDHPDNDVRIECINRLCRNIHHQSVNLLSSKTWDWMKRESSL